MQPVMQQRTLAATNNAQQQGAVIQRKPLPRCYVIGGVSGSGKRQVALHAYLCLQSAVQTQQTCKNQQLDADLQHGRTLASKQAEVSIL